MLTKTSTEQFLFCSSKKVPFLQQIWKQRECPRFLLCESILFDRGAPYLHPNSAGTFVKYLLQGSENMKPLYIPFNYIRERFAFTVSTKGVKTT